MLISKLSDVGTDGLVCTNFPHLRSKFLSMADVVRRKELEERGDRNLEKLGLPFGKWRPSALSCGCSFLIPIATSMYTCLNKPCCSDTATSNVLLTSKF
jgi:hypothetical protein